MTFALLSYGVGSVTLERFKLISTGVLSFLTIGLALDITGITCMIIGATGSVFTLHGSLGYSALFVMMINIILIWRKFLQNGKDSKIEKSLLFYAKMAYGWWVITYFTGSLMVIF